MELTDKTKRGRRRNGRRRLCKKSCINERLDEQQPKKAVYRVTLEAATGLLRRDAEFEAANKKGRHREADMQMKTFADKFGANLAATLPSISRQHVGAPSRLLGTNKRQVKAAIEHQRAVRNDMASAALSGVVAFRLRCGGLSRPLR